MKTPAPHNYLIDGQANLHIEVGGQRTVLAPADAVALVKFIERANYLPQATRMIQEQAK